MSRASSPLPLSHGMHGDTVIPDWPTLTAEEIAHVLRHYPQVGAIAHLVWHSPRPFSAGCIVTTTNMEVFVKRHHHAVRDAAGLIEEHAFMHHLRSRGIAVSTVLTTIDAATTVSDGQWTYEVHALAAGLDLYRDAPSWTPLRSTGHAYAAGRAMAQLHLGAQDFSAPARQTRTLVTSFTIFSQTDPLPALQRYIAHRPALADYLAQRNWLQDSTAVLLPWHARLRPYLDELTPLWTHNDWHASNLLWSNASDMAQVVTVLDFGLSDQTCALHDLATAIERNMVEWLTRQDNRTVHLDLLDALLDGYHAVLPLSPRQWLALAALLPLVHVEFALAEVDYFHGITHSPQNAALAYDGYFIGHAAWFNSAPGGALLQHIKQRAQRKCA